MIPKFISAALPGETFNIACGERVSLNGLIEELRSISGREIEPAHEDPRPGLDTDQRYVPDFRSRRRPL